MREIILLTLFGMSRQASLAYRHYDEFSTFFLWQFERYPFCLCRFSSTATVSTAEVTYVGCDFYQTLELNQWYDVFSPLFPQNYQPNTFCRWTACAPVGSVVIVNCTVIKIPPVSIRHDHGQHNGNIHFYFMFDRFDDDFGRRISLNIAIAIVSKSLYRVAKIWMMAQHIVRTHHLSASQNQMRWSWVSVSEFFIAAFQLQYSLLVNVVWKLQHWKRLRILWAVISSVKY